MGEDDSSSPIVSVIIPNLNSPVIDQTLEALRAQDYALGTVEVLVVGLDEPGLVSTDDLVQLIPTGDPVTPAVARNIGIRRAKGELLCFTDADCIPARDWLARLTAPFVDGAVQVVGGGVTFETDNYWTLCDNLSWFHEFLVSAKQGQRALLPSLNLCVRRGAIDQVGLFNENYPKAAGEDAEWTTRMRQAGYVLHFRPDAVVCHRPTRARFKALWHHAHIYGRYSVKVNPEFAGLVGVPMFMRRWWSILLLAPVLALMSTARIYGSDRAVWRHWRTAPGIFVSKLAWCFGASRTLCRDGRLTRTARQ